MITGIINELYTYNIYKNETVSRTEICMVSIVLFLVNINTNYYYFMDTQLEEHMYSQLVIYTIILIMQLYRMRAVLSLSTITKYNIDTLELKNFFVLMIYIENYCKYNPLLLNMLREKKCK